jgi:hypothetical protein
MSKRRRAAISAPLAMRTAGNSQPVGKSEDCTPPKTKAMANREPNPR